MKKILFILLTLVLAGSAVAQPKKSRLPLPKNGQKTGAVATTASRAELMFPKAVQMPEEVVWRRDVYRSIDLTKDENAPLYYPVEPQGKQVNLFTLLFQLLNQGKIPAYQYKLDGIEDFRQENRMHFKEMLDRYFISYQIQGGTIQVDAADIPSSEVLSFYVKESSYYDQATATYHSQVTALCPVLHRADEFSFDPVKYPLFWVKYDDVATFLAGHTVMTSNLNNAAAMSMADFFATNHYQGKIYMTTNMQGKTLQEKFPTDSLMKKEQARIEKEMTDFEKNIWTTPVDSAEQAKKDSIAAAQAAGKKARKQASASSASATSARTTARASSQSKSSSSQSKSSSGSGSSGKKSKSSASSAPSAPRVTVRRQRH